MESLKLINAPIILMSSHNSQKNTELSLMVDHENCVGTYGSTGKDHSHLLILVLQGLCVSFDYSEGGELWDHQEGHRDILSSPQALLEHTHHQQDVSRSLTERSKMKWISCHLLVTILLFWLLMLMHISTADAALDPQEENTLNVLRVAIALPNWTGDPCKETWIQCSNGTTQSVLALKLPGRNLTGTIPDDIAKLRNISQIDFNTNQLSGPIPDIRNLTNLTILSMPQNNFSGGIPEYLFRLTSLREVDLHANYLNGTIPKSLENMTQAKYINLRSNLLVGPLPNLSALVNLEQFDGSLNGLVGPLPDVDNLPNLFGLSLAHNFLSGPIPPSVFNHSKLQWLFMSNNSIDSAPIPDMRQLTGLWTLNARLCNFQGPIPSLENNKFLQELQVQLNNLTSISSDLRNNTFLKAVIVHSNIISGNLPELPAAASQPIFKLARIDFSNNSFSGGIPKSWADLSFLEEMQIGNNKLHAAIPKEFGNLRSLKKLNLSNNLFYGPIPEEISFLPELQILDLRNNQLSGMVPERLVNLSKLESLYLDNNNFTGIPVALATKKNLTISFGNLRVIFGNETTSTHGSSLSTGGIIGVAAGAICVGIAVLAILLLLLRKRKKYKHQLCREDMPKSAQEFSLKQIKTMTQNFKKLIGKGGFGPVYYGKLPNGKEVAVKVRAMDSKQGAKEFLNEVRLLSRLHHRNLVPLVGYCLEAQEQILLYTYMSQGTLHDHLHGLSGSSFSQKETLVSESFTQPLDWKTRLDIAINAARGLEYLHKDCNPPVIHRDVKSSNILLTEKLEAKFGDLGISKQAHEPDTGETLNMTGITTAIKGTFGYLDPEYFTRQRLTTKSDVYGFGIILLEIITGKKAQAYNFPDSDATSLKDWVEGAVSKTNVKSIVDPALKGNYNEDGMLMVVKTALSCVLPTGAERPEMGDIVHTLIEALQMEKQFPGESIEIPSETSQTLSGQHSIPYISESLEFSSTGSVTHSPWNTDPR